MKKILSLIIAVFILAVLIIPQNSYAMTPKEIVELINQLKKQIKELERQLSEAGGMDEEWCYDFKKNLRIGDEGKEIDELNNVLVKEGVLETGTFEHSINFPAVFGEQTAAAVVSLQEKYASEILRPLGLKRGTGYVGAGTRKVLNRLYGCKKLTKSSIMVISPNGGETLKVGGTFEIKWNQTQNTEVSLGLRNKKLSGLTEDVEFYIKNIADFKGSEMGENKYLWKIPNNLKIDNNYEICVAGYFEGGFGTRPSIDEDCSDNVFRIER